MMAPVMQNAGIGLGEVKNRFGWLTSKKGQEGFNPQQFLLDTGMKPATASGPMGTARTAMYKDFIPLKPTNDLRRKVIDLVIAADIAYELCGRSDTETAKWIVSPNMLLFGETPFEVCMRGEGRPLIAWLLDRAGQSGLVAKKE